MKQSTHRDRKIGMTKAADFLFTAVIQQKGRWYLGMVRELPGAGSQGRTLAEVRRNLKEAVN